MTKKELFEVFVNDTNYNLGRKGNLSKPLASGMKLARSMGKEIVAAEFIHNLAPSQAYVHPDPRLDGLKEICETMVQSQELVEERKLVA